MGGRLPPMAPCGGGVEPSAPRTARDGRLRDGRLRDGRLRECQAVRIPEAATDNWPVGPAVVFTWTGDEPHPAIEDMLDAMDVQWVRTQYHGRDAILGFLTEAHVMGQDVLASGPV